MRLTLNFTDGTVTIERHPYSLDQLKEFLIAHYPELVSKFVICAIRSGTYGGIAFTYDWKEIIRRAHVTVLPIHHFLTHNPSAQHDPEQQNSCAAFLKHETPGY